MLNGKPPGPDAGYARALESQREAAIAKAAPHCVDLNDKSKPYYSEDPTVHNRRAGFKAIGGNGWRLGDLLPTWKP